VPYFIILTGGPHNGLTTLWESTKSCRELPSELRFYIEPVRDIYRRPSRLIAPRHTADGPLMYKRVGKNFLGHWIYKYEGGM
jgi:hypothetical protein